MAIYSLGNKLKSFSALIDTGSPVNLVKKSIYDNYFYNNKLLQTGKNLNLKGINDSSIIIYGKIHDQISLKNAEDGRT